MDMTVDLKSALTRWALALEKAAPELNELDARLGDGDLGVTLQKCAKNSLVAIAQESQTPQQILRDVSQACADASGSSFGTLLASGFFSSAKWLEDGHEIDRNSLSDLLQHIVMKLSARGGAYLGDKTMLDSLHAISVAIGNASSQDDIKTLALNAANQVLEDFRHQPNRIGRARMFGDKSIGQDDPGMVAILRMVEGL